MKRIYEHACVSLNAAYTAFGLLVLAAMLGGCTVSEAYRPYMQVGVHYDMKKPTTFGQDDTPWVGTFRFVQPVGVQNPEASCDRWTWAQLELWEHHSSVPDFYDKNTFDGPGGVFNIPLGRRVKQ